MASELERLIKQWQDDDEYESARWLANAAEAMRITLIELVQSSDLAGLASAGLAEAERAAGGK